MRASIGAVAASVCLAAQTRAQDTTTAKSVVCSGQRIDTVKVFSAERAVAGVLKLPLVSQIARVYHVTTRDRVIRSFMLLTEGDACDELRRAESERILRAQPFLAEATVQTVSGPMSGVTLIVKTVDEASLVIGGQLQAGVPPVRAVKLGNSNVDGSAIYLAGLWQDGGIGYRDGFGARFIDGQFLGKPSIFEASGERHPLGEEWLVGAAQPFLTDLQRVAWRARACASIEFVGFPGLNPYDPALRLDRRYYDIGGIVRIGPPGRLSLFGASVSSDDERPSTQPVLISDAGLVRDTTALLMNRYQPHHMARLNVLWGVRDLLFVSVQGFDALYATQDLPVGFQFGTMFGRTLSVLGSKDDDIFMASDLYAGVGGEQGAARLEVRAEGRRANATAQWDGLLTSGRASQLIKFAPNQALIASLDWSGGWRSRVPFNLPLGAYDGGVEGFANSPAFGGRRAAARLEQRWAFGRIGNAATGVALFVDAGRVWVGDVPYGVTTPVRGAVGISLLGALPRQSHRTWRVDVTYAQPSVGAPRRIQLSLSGEDHTRAFLVEPRDVERTRERTVPSSIFHWP